jgi:hypothetical protein
LRGWNGAGKCLLTHSRISARDFHTYLIPADWQKWHYFRKNSENSGVGACAAGCRRHSRAEAAYHRRVRGEGQTPTT